MAKIALITDTHFGLKNDSPIVLEYFATFFRDYFFPTIDKFGIKTVIHLGDLVDRRKHIGFLTAKTMRECYIEPSLERGLVTHIIVGNHDGFYKNTNEVNALTELLRTDNFKVYSDPGEFSIGKTTFGAVPWVTKENESAVSSFLDTTTAKVVVSHLELSGFEMDSGTVCSSDTNEFVKSKLNRFDLVLSGHFHHKSEQGVVKYLGAPYDMTVSDTWDTKGFHLFDTVTNSLEFIPNNSKLFHQVSYNGTTEILQDFSHLTNKYVRLTVTDKSDLFRYETFFNRLERSNPASLKVIDRTELHFDDNTVSTGDGVMDTRKIIDNYIDAITNVSVSKDALKSYIAELYTRAQVSVD